MKTIVKLLVVFAVLHAAARGGIAAWRYYELRDTAQQLVLFGAQDSPEELQHRILRKAIELELPLRPEDVVVGREGLRTVAEARYRQPVEFFPSYTYPIDFAFSVNAYALSGLK